MENIKERIGLYLQNGGEPFQKSKGGGAVEVWSGRDALEKNYFLK